MKNILMTITIAFLTSPQLAGQNIYTSAGTGTAGFSGDGGSALTAQLDNPKSVAVDAAGNLYIADYNNQRIRKVNNSGVISTFAGIGTQGFSGDGGNATSAEFNWPIGVAVDQSGNVYVVDIFNHRIRKINSAGIISTFAGTGNAGYNGDGIAATSADLNNPFGVATDALGNVYIADNFNNRVRKVSTSGIITTIAGTGTSGFSGDGGQAINAKLNNPNSVAVDVSGNVYIADYSNNRIRKINTSGIISTIAGTTISGYGGDGGLATSAYISNPHEIAFDAAGNIYFADTGNSRIRKINAGGTITTFAGGTGSYGGDGGPAANSGILWPWGVTFDVAGNMYIGDAGNNRIREVCFASCLASVKTNTKESEKFIIAPNPNNGSFRLKTSVESYEIVIFNSVGQVVFKKHLSHDESNISITNLPTGIYNFVMLQNDGQTISDKLLIE